MDIKERRISRKTVTVLDNAANGLLAVLFLMGIHYFYLHQPVMYAYLVAEDNWGAYATFVLFFLSSLVLSWALLKHPEFRRPGHFGLAALLFFLAMEEISWGQRIFHLDVPDVFRRLNTQGELNLHNFATSKMYYPYIGPAILVGAIALPVLAGLLPSLRRGCDRLGIPIVPPRHWPLFLVAVYLLDYYWHFVNLSMNKEVAELALSLAALVMITDYVPKPKIDKNHAVHARQRLALFGLPLIGTTILVLGFDDPHSLRWQLQMLSTRDYVERGYLTQAAELFDYLARNPRFAEAAEENIQYSHGLVLLKLGQSDKAETVLNEALKKVESQAIENTRNSANSREIGRILQVLGRVPESQQAYLRALEEDRTKLLDAMDSEARARHRWSLAKTLFAMGLTESAAEQIRLAAEITPFANTRKNLLRWMRDETQKMKNLLPSTQPALNIEIPSIPGAVE